MGTSLFSDIYREIFNLRCGFILTFTISTHRIIDFRSALGLPIAHSSWVTGISTKPWQRRMNLRL
jgi:hypothetical protein